MESSDQASRGRMKMWSAKEDKVLIDCLLTLKVEQKWMADNGFKVGFANALQTMMEQKLPGCGIKATPHITSRIKTLKRLWQMAYDMVYGVNTSGFGWDPDTKFVTAEPAVWEEYLKAYQNNSLIEGENVPPSTTEPEGAHTPVPETEPFPAQPYGDIARMLGEIVEEKVAPLKTTLADVVEPWQEKGKK
ncbi:hypothetical protein K1719_032885 [Acacia pycnantha]|nr:hypothetical protein K1719_032885 [Acacia pycnantha]